MHDITLHVFITNHVVYMKRIKLPYIPTKDSLISLDDDWLKEFEIKSINHYIFSDVTCIDMDYCYGDAGIPDETEIVIEMLLDLGFTKLVNGW